MPFVKGVAMSEQLEGRLKLLKAELETAQRTLADLEAREDGMRATILRLKAAIQALEEELIKAGGASRTSI